MLLVLLISAIISALLVLIAIVKGWVFLPIIWISCSLGLVVLGWLAVIFIRPHYPDWWERNIAGIDNGFFEL